MKQQLHEQNASHEVELLIKVEIVVIHHVVEKRCLHILHDVKTERPLPSTSRQSEIQV
jgi:hypothetical protein